MYCSLEPVLASALAQTCSITYDILPALTIIQSFPEGTQWINPLKPFTCCGVSVRAGA